MLFALPHRETSSDRPAPAAAVLSSLGLGGREPMGRRRPRPPRREDADRDANGRIRYDRLRRDLGNTFSNLHRVAPINPDLADVAVKMLGASARLDRKIRSGWHPDRERSIELKAELQGWGVAVHQVDAAARDERLSYPAGVLYLRHAFGDDPEHAARSRCYDDANLREQCSPCRQARLMHRASLAYAALHCAVWGGLKQDIAEALTPEDLRELLGTGRSGTPRRHVPSHLGKLLVSIVGTEDPGDPKERQKRREATAHRYWAAREAMMQVGLGALMMVERIVIDELPPGPAGMPGMWRLSTNDGINLRLGLSALITALRLDEPRRGDRAGTNDGASTITDVIKPARARRGLGIEFSRATDGSPDAGAVALSVARLRQAAR